MEKNEIKTELQEIKILSLTNASIIAIWDFDHTMIDVNSDTHIFEVLNPILEKKRDTLRLNPKFHVWTDLMGEMLRLLFEAGISQSSLLECLSSILIHDDALKTIHLLHSKGIPQYIMSDANSIFIHTILKANKLENIFLSQNIFTNPAWWDNEKNNNILCVKYYHQDPHSCSLCPRNLCKGKILKEEILSKDQKDNNSELKIIYFGDGGGDLCPILSIPNGIAMARTDYILHKRIISTWISYFNSYFL